MHLKVNDSSNFWRYDYKGTEGHNDWFDMETGSDASEFDRWMRLNRVCAPSMNKLAGSKANDHTKEEIIQESWIAYAETRHLIETMSRREYLSYYGNAVKKRVVINNEFGKEMNQASYERLTGSKANLQVLMATQTNPEDDEGWRGVNLGKYCTQEEYRMLLDHVVHGRAGRFASSQSAYSKSVKKLMQRIKKDAEADKELTCI